MARSDIKNRVGENTLNKDGEKMTIVEWNMVFGKLKSESNTDFN